MCARAIHRVKWRHRIYGYKTIAILWVEHDIKCWVSGRRFIALFKWSWIKWSMIMSLWSLTDQQSAFNIYESFTHKMAAKTSWHRYGTKLRHCHSMYSRWQWYFRQVCATGVHGNGEDSWVPWDSHGNGSKISHEMGMGWEWELSAWEWELRRGSWHQQLWIVVCSYIVTWSKGSNAGGATAWDWASCAELK